FASRTCYGIRWHADQLLLRRVARLNREVPNSGRRHWFTDDIFNARCRRLLGDKPLLKVNEVVSASFQIDQNSVRRIEDAAVQCTFSRHSHDERAKADSLNPSTNVQANCKSLRG